LDQEEIFLFAAVRVLGLSLVGEKVVVGGFAEVAVRVIVGRCSVGREMIGRRMKRKK